MLIICLCHQCLDYHDVVRPSNTVHMQMVIASFDRFIETLKNENHNKKPFLLLWWNVSACNQN